jgi:hypothetical protein
MARMKMGRVVLSSVIEDDFNPEEFTHFWHAAIVGLFSEPRQI